MDSVTITIGTRWRIRRYDKRSWVVEEFRAPDPDNNRTKSTEPCWTQANGDGFGPFFAKPESCLRWLMDYRALNDVGGEYTLDEAVEKWVTLKDEMAGCLVAILPDD